MLFLRLPLGYVIDGAHSRTSCYKTPCGGNPRRVFCYRSVRIYLAEGTLARGFATCWPPSQGICDSLALGYAIEGAHGRTNCRNTPCGGRPRRGVCDILSLGYAFGFKNAHSHTWNKRRGSTAHNTLENNTPRAITDSEFILSVLLLK